MMKRIQLIIALVFCMGIHVNAQDEMDRRARFTGGLKVGANYSNVYDAKGEEFNASAKGGLAGGLFLSIPIGTFLGIQPEALISQKGFRATGRLLTLPYDFTRTTTFLDIPLLLAVKPASFFTLLVGPQYSYLLKQKDVFSTSVTTIEQEQEFNNDNIRKNILCFTGGFDVNIQHLVIGVRAGADVQNNNGDGTSSTPRYKNMWYQGTIGYRF